MDRGVWNALLGMLGRGPLAIPHTGLRFLAVVAGFITAFLLMLASFIGEELNQFLFVGAFAVLILALVLLGAYFLHADKTERMLNREMRMSNKMKEMLRERVQKELERKASEPPPAKREKH